MRNEHDMRPIRGIAAALAMGLLAGCGPSESPRSASQQPQGSEQYDEAPPPVAEQEQASLPDGFPEQFPLPPGFEVTQGEFTPGDSMTQANYLVRGTSTASVTEVAEFYHHRLPQSGYEVQQWQPVTPSMTTALVYFHGERVKDASVQLASDGGLTSVLISLPLRD